MAAISHTSSSTHILRRIIRSLPIVQSSAHSAVILGFARTFRPPPSRHINLWSIPQRRPFSSMQQSEISSSPTRNIKLDLEFFKHDKWGWVIYRTSFDDDAAWERFKKIIEEQSRKQISESDTPELADSLEWTFVDDPSLDGAPKELLRQHFKAWGDEAVTSENPRAVRNWRSSRYSYFIQADQASIHSVVESDPNDLLDEGWVNFINADWELNPEEAEQREGGYEAVEGCYAEDVGWMMITTSTVGPCFYEVIGNMPENWYLWYRRPDDILIY